jgi:hypothetical protein
MATEHKVITLVPTRYDALKDINERLTQTFDEWTNMGEGWKLVSVTWAGRLGIVEGAFVIVFGREE